jgi:predicted DNA-binding protein
MDKDKRITTIVLDKEADRKSKIIAEFTGKTLSAIYREALDMYFSHFVNNDLLSEVNEYLDKLYWQYKIDNPHIFAAVQFGNLSNAAVMIAEAVKQLPQEPEAQKLIDEGMRLISILSK